MMTRIAFDARYAQTALTDENTIAEAKVAKQIKKSLQHYFKKEAAAYLLRTEDVNLKEVEKNWVTVTYEVDAKPTGSVRISLRAAYEHGHGGELLQTYKVAKRNLFR